MEYSDVWDSFMNETEKMGNSKRKLELLIEHYNMYRAEMTDEQRIQLEQEILDTREAIKQLEFLGIIDPETVSVDIDPETVSVDIEPETVSVDIKPETVSVDIEPETVSVDIKPETVSVDIDPETVSVDIDPETVSVDMDPETVSVDMDPETVSVDIEPETVNVDKKPEKKETPETDTEPKKESETEPSVDIPPMPKEEDYNFDSVEALKMFEKEIKEEYLFRKQDMLDKQYGNAKKKEEYKIRFDRYLRNIDTNQKFEFYENGTKKTGNYTTIADYPEKEEDEKFLQLEEYKERIERLSKYQAGDKSAYNSCRDKDIVREQDEFYTSTYNGMYNKNASLQKSLMTLGNFGENLPYSKMGNSKLPIKILKGIRNGLVFVRNHTTAPIYRFIGSKIVAPIHRAIKKDSSNAYNGGFTHRYEARKQYFADNGDGFIKQRLNAIFKYKEGNRAVSAAKAHDILESIKIKYINRAVNIQYEKMYTDLCIKLDKQILELNNKLSEDKISDAEKVKIENAIKEREQKRGEYYDKVVYIIHQKEHQKDTAIIQTDAIDIKTRENRDKKNVTRAVTIAKAVTIAGVKFLGPRIEKYIIGKTRKEEIYTWTDKQGNQKVVDRQWVEGSTKTTHKTTQEWIEPTYKDEVVPIYKDTIDSGKSVHELINANSGNKITGYYSVYGGEKGASLYELSDNDKITAIFQSQGKRRNRIF